VTHRGLSRGVTVVTGTGDDGEVNDLSGLARTNTTIVVLMGIKHRATISADLIRGGLDGETPIAVIERAWLATQRTVRATLQELATLRVENPAVIVIGDVAALDLRSVVTQGRLVSA
jgi:uroporphyrin-III C-methyltransferase